MEVSFSSFVSMQIERLKDKSTTKSRGRKELSIIFSECILDIEDQQKSFSQLI